MILFPEPPASPAPDAPPAPARRFKIPFTALVALVSASLILHPSSLRAISVGTTEADTSPEAELKSFTTLDGFEVSLFASEKDGVAKPISMRWDELGRLWVITAQSYPQPQPGEVCNDKVLILEDTKHSGHADKVTVFADGLRMPTGIELAPSATWPLPPTPRSGGLIPPTKNPPRSGKNEASGSAAGADGASTAVENHRSLNDDRHPMAAYIGEGEKLWIMRDLDGDGHADVKEVVFSGFGTGDMHQCLNSFTWTPDGALMFSQGLHNDSNVTTPWGGRRLYGAGFWMYRPLRAQLTPYPTGFPLNAWGTVYDDAGQPFTVAGAAGMFWTTPLLVAQYGDEGARSDANSQSPNANSYSVHLIEGRALPNNGQIVKKGMLKYCGIDIPRNAHWPADMHGELVSGGFFENCIYRHKLITDKANPSGYEAVRQPDLLKSSSVAFRPVDVKFGPDGALYISDWYNPIIGHYQASFRHPDRDKTHGRIWRVVKKGSPLVKMRDLSKMDASQLLETIWKNEDRWANYQAQRLLMGISPSDIFKSTHLQAYKPGRSENPHFKEPLESNELSGAAFGMYIRMGPNSGRTDPVKRADELLRLERLSLKLDQWFEKPEDFVFDSGISSTHLAVRANATRTIGLWQDRLKDPLGSLANLIADENPRVRLEAIVACAHIPQPESIGIALRALDKPFDSFHARALEAAVFALAPYWEPALRDGKLTLPPKHLAWLLDKKSDGDTLARIRTTLKEKPGNFDAESRRALLLMLAKRGSSEDVALALDAGLKDYNLLFYFADLVEAQQIKPPPNAQTVLASAGINVLTTKLIGLWKLTALTPQLKATVRAADTPPVIKRVILVALARLNAEHDLIQAFADDHQLPFDTSLGAIEALSLYDGRNAAKAAVALMPRAYTEEEMRALLAPFLAKAGRVKPLLAAITGTPPCKEAADLASRALAMMGRNEPELSAALNKILGRTAVVMPYDAQWVSSLANEATVAGSAKHGGEIFHRATMACLGCHSIANVGGIIGPQLDAVGRGVPVELLVEAVMWPQRQIKEGYVATTVVMKDGRTLVGYKQKESGTELTIRDLASNTMTTLQKSQMQQRTDAGSLMPDGLTASLSREELRDLIAYLASLGKDEKK